jgi:hypothetical protein
MSVSRTNCFDHVKRPEVARKHRRFWASHPETLKIRQPVWAAFDSHVIKEPTKEGKEGQLKTGTKPTQLRRCNHAIEPVRPGGHSRHSRKAGLCYLRYLLLNPVTPQLPAYPGKSGQFRVNRTLKNLFSLVPSPLPPLAPVKFFRIRAPAAEIKPEPSRIQAQSNRIRAFSDLLGLNTNGGRGACESRPIFSAPRSSLRPSTCPRLAPHGKKTCFCNAPHLSFSTT